MLRQPCAPSPCARKLTPSVHAVLCLQGQPLGAVLRLPFSLSVEETTPFEAKLWSFKKKRRVFEKTRPLSSKNSPVFGTLFSPFLAVVGSSEDRVVEGEFSFHKVKSRSHDWGYRAL